MEQHNNESGHNAVHMPEPTAAPMALALGITLIITGMVTHVAVTLLGVILSLAASYKWFRAVLPVEAHEMVPVREEEIVLVTSRKTIEKLPLSPIHRKMVPVETFRFSTGLKGGIAGGIAMIVPATLFSLLKFHSLWYAMNLMAAGGFVTWTHESNEFLAQFHMEGLLAALAIHAVTSLLVGSLYGAMLPMFPRWPILTAGFLAPLLWTGLLASALNIVSPILNERIDWIWFIPSQIAFGLVAGYVVNLDAKVRTRQFQSLPFVLRAGVQGAIEDRDGENSRKDGEQ